MKKWMMLMLLVLLCLGTSGCGSKTTETGEVTDTSPTASAIKIGLLRIDDSFPFYVARQEGLFEKHGVNVELIDFSSGRDQSTALDAGELDGLMTDPVVASLSMKGGTDLRIVATALGAVPEEGRFLLVAAPNSGITSPEQLQGKTIAISNNTMMDYLMAQFEDIFALDSVAIQKVNMPDLMLRTTTLLEGKDIDAAILPDPLAAYAVAEGAISVIDDTQLDTNLSQSVLAMTAEQISENREDVEKMLAAYEEAISLINADPEKYQQLALECAKVPASLADTYPTPTFTANAIPTEEELQRVSDWLVGRGLLDTAYSYEQLVDTSFVQP